MTERNSRSVVVVDPGGRAVAMIMGANLLSLYEPNAPAGTAADLMSQPIITADPDLWLAAADLMITREVYRLVVVDPAATHDVLIGVVSATPRRLIPRFACRVIRRTYVSSGSSAARPARAGPWRTAGRAPNTFPA